VGEGHGAMKSSMRLRSGVGPQGGFTLMELVVVMGILTGFLMMLVQFVGQGVSLFDEGESGQALADRTDAARTVVTRELQTIAADGRRIEPGLPDDRLLAQRFSIGLPARPLATDSQAVLLRAGIQLDPMQEEELIERDARARVEAEYGAAADPEEVEQAVRAIVARTPLRGRGRLILAQFAQEVESEPPGASLIEVRVGHFLVDQRIRVGDDWVDPFLVPFPGGADLPAVEVYRATRPLVKNLLHFDLHMWSQATRSWTSGIGAAQGGPEAVWDSARAGLLSGDGAGANFSFDLGEPSLLEPTDDVHPHAMRVTLVVAVAEDGPREGLLAARLAREDSALLLVDGEAFPGALDGGFVKVGSEWMRYASREGDRLRGLQRGVRGTSPREHPATSIVRVGRTVEFTIPFQHGKDDFNRDG
jgi:type II secretory pathway pseudopilin PulG